MKLSNIKIFSLIALFSILLIIVLLVIPQTFNYTTNHEYLEGIVIKKEYKEAYNYYYGNQYIFIPEEFIIIAEYKYNGQIYNFEHSVSQPIYNNYNINDKITFCFLHKKLLEYEK